jgi:hypothetical protein
MQRRLRMTGRVQRVSHAFRGRGVHPLGSTTYFPGHHVLNANRGAQSRSLALVGADDSGAGLARKETSPTPPNWRESARLLPPRSPRFFCVP